MKEIMLASNNPGKCLELQQLFEPLSIRLIPQGKRGLSSVEETGLSFVENAILKARHAAQATGLPALADDSGISVDYLQGAPGIYSARFGGVPGDDQNNNKTLLKALEGVPKEKRQASFHCVLVYMQHAEDPTPLIAHGQWDGVILDAPAGKNGFGYDPIFYIPEHQCASAELPTAIKHQMSHRAKALQQLMQKFPKE